jgi:hypothetical protein
MSRHAIRYRMDDGQFLTIPDLLQHKQNTWPVTYQCVYERLKAGDRTVERLLRPTRGRPAITKPPAPKVTPWRLGPSVRTENARRTYDELRGDTPPQQDVTGERFGALRVLRHGPMVGGSPTWTCQCDCGNKATYWAGMLRSGVAEDCGCGVSHRRASA